MGLTFLSGIAVAAHIGPLARYRTEAGICAPTFMQARISSEPRRAHRLAPVLVLADEPTWPETISDRMLAALHIGC